MSASRGSDTDEGEQREAASVSRCLLSGGNEDETVFDEQSDRDIPE